MDRTKGIMGKLDGWGKWQRRDNGRMVGRKWEWFNEKQGGNNHPGN